MKRSNLNFLIDALAFAALLLLVTTGMVLEYQLPAGSGGREGAGFGRGAWDRPVETLWGWTRHEWGAFHFWTAWTMMAILTVHLALHWKWIVCIVQGRPTSASGARLVLGGAGLAAVVGLTAIPLLSRTQTTTRGELEAMPPGAAKNGDSHADVDAAGSPQRVRGSMTLAQVAAACGQSTDWLIDQLELPSDARPTDSIGRLLRASGRPMNDLREIVATANRSPQ